MRAKREISLLAGWAILAAVITCLPVPMLLGQSILIDDTFYSLAAARHLAAGNGSTVDGLHPTNGYQPLWVWILAALTAALRLAPDGTVRAALVLCALASAGAGLLVARLVRDLGGSDRAAGWSAALWLLNPYLLRRQLNGLEAALAALLLLAFVREEVRGQRAGAPRGAGRVEGRHPGGGAPDGTVSRRGSPWAKEARTGLLGGMAALARVDLCVLIPLLALRRRGLAAAVASFVVAPWLAWCWVKFGSPVPLSGEANRVVFRALRGLPGSSLIFWDPGDVSWTLASIFGLGWPAAAFERLGLPRTLVWLVVPGALALVALVAGGAGLRDRLRAWWDSARPLVFWCASLAVFLGASYALFYPAPWHLNRYFLPLHALWVVCAALFFDRAVASRPRPPASPDLLSAEGALAERAAQAGREARSAGGAPAAHGRKPGHGASAAGAAPADPRGARRRKGLWWSLWGAGLVAGLVPYFVDTTGGQPPSLPLEVARWIRERVPAGARVGVVQSGVVGYYAGRPIVNLDGKVNPRAMRALRAGRMGDYLEEEGIEIFGDWNDLVERCVFGRAGSGDLRGRAERLPAGVNGVPPPPFAFYRMRTE